MPGQHITDEQRRKFIMLIKQNASVEVAAAKSGFGRTTGFAIKKELKTGSRKESKPRGSRRPDPLKDIFDSQVAPILSCFERCRKDLKLLFMI